MCTYIPVPFICSCHIHTDLVQLKAIKFKQLTNSLSPLQRELAWVHCPRTVATRICTRLFCRPNNNICKSHIRRKIMLHIKWCVVIFSPQPYSRSQTELYDDRSAFCWGQWAWVSKRKKTSHPPQTVVK